MILVHVGTRTKRKLSPSDSAFEDTKPYVLTERGRNFVHYVMEVWPVGLRD